MSKGVKMSHWTQEQVSTLKDLWNKGHSAGDIAQRINGFSRNAVIGKVHRLGLSRRTPRVTEVRVKRRRITRKANAIRRERKTEICELVAARINPNAKPMPESTLVPLEGTTPVKLLDLEHHHCRWPIGDPQDAGFGFCGCQKAAGTPYCEAHANRAYQGRTAEDLLEEAA